MTEKAKKALQEVLHPGETIRWEGGTQPFGILDGRDGKMALLQWILSPLCLGALIFALARRESPDGRLIAFVLLILAMLIVSPILSYRRALRLRYCITDERVFSVTAGGEVSDMPLALARSYRSYPVGSGVALALGEALEDEKDRQLRWRALHPKDLPEGSGVGGMVLYNPEGLGEVERLLRA